MTRPTTKQVLMRAREIIATPATWLQGDFAADADGKPVNSLDETAICFCSLGAVRLAAFGPAADKQEYSALLARKMLGVACRALTRGESDNVAKFNDEHEHAEVLALFDLAIQYAE